MKYWLEILRKSFVVFPTKIVSVNPFLKLNLEKVFMKTRKSFFIKTNLSKKQCRSEYNFSGKQKRRGLPSPLQN